MALEVQVLGHFSAKPFLEKKERGTIIKISRKSTQNSKPKFKRRFLEL
ncbi:hypothetical protein M5D96_001876, partial [Drosophila gunungcola]